jgi:hypothetical protein
MNIIPLEGTLSFLLIVLAVCINMTDARTCEVGVALAQLFRSRNADLKKKIRIFVDIVHNFVECKTAHDDRLKFVACSSRAQP